MNLKERLPLISVIATSALCIGISILALKAGIFIIFQNLFYIPIVIACFYFRKRGLAIAAALAVIYFLLFISFTSDQVMIWDALIRVLLFILIAAVITSLSTARARAEAALAEEREKFRTVADYTYDWEYWIDPQRNIPYISPSCERITGYRPEEFLADAGLLANVVHVADRQIFQDHADRCNDNNKNDADELDFRIVTRAGEVRWIAHTCQPVYGSDGRFRGRRASNRNITARKEAEEDLRHSEERYRTILEDIEEGYQEMDPKGNFTFCNESFCKIFGYGREELLNSNIRHYAADEETADRIYRAYQQIYRTGDPLKRFEGEIVTRQGERRLIEFSASLLRDREGRRRGFRGIVRDVTERKNMGDQYRMIANSSQTGVYIVQDGRLRFVNPHISKYSGYREEELIGRQVLHFVHPADWEMVREKAGKMLAGLLKSPYEYRMVDKAGRVRWLTETVTPITYRGRSAVLGNTMDTTDRKEAEKKLQDLLENLRKAVGATVQVMVAAVEARDPYTAGHQARSADLARAIAREMGLPQDRIDGIRMAGSIHDIGKLSVPAEILSKPSKLSDIEFSLIREHACKGYKMLKDVASPWPLAEIVYQHHERLDGSGYPRGLKGEEIIIEARILAVADVVESMASYRPYRPALGLEEALAEIERHQGKLYDADVVAACLRLFREKSFQFEGTRS